MVMTRTFRKSILRELKQSPGRFIAIFFIIAIGAGFFAGVGCTAPSMLFTAENHFRDSKLADFRLISTMGITDKDVQEVRNFDGVATVMPRYAFNAKVSQGDFVCVASLKSLPTNTENNPNYLNQLTVISGRLPEKSGECVVDSKSGARVGDKFIISDDIEGGEVSMLKTTEIEVVGTVISPEYISFSRGNTSLGSGEIYTFIFINEQTFDSEYYTEINLLLDESIKMSPFSGKYKTLIDTFEEKFEALGLRRAQVRHSDILAEAEEEIAEAEQEIADAEAELATAIADTNAELEDARRKINDGIAEYEKGRKQYLENYDTIVAGEAELEKAKALLASVPPGTPPEMLPFDIVELQSQIAANGAKLAAGRQALEEARLKLERAATDLKSGEADYHAGRAEAEEKFAEAQTEIDDARVEIADARTELADLEKPEWLIFTRDDNPGYSMFEQNADRINILAMTIPPFMFVIAALVCLTTMTRLIEEQRTTIGTLKALGYSRRSILSKYMFYSIFISLSGSIVGVIAGVLIFPPNIWHAYGEMFLFPTFDLLAVPIICIIALLAGVLVTVAVTFYSCYNAQNSVAAELMRPKAPKPGKRVLLERITFIWRNLTFNQKATLRNLFRYKKRLVMTILGVAGCCALLVAIIGLNDSITGIADKQYTEISHYNISVLLNEDADRADVKKLLSEKGDFTLAHESSGLLLANNKDTSNYTLTVTVPETPSDFSDFVSLLNNDNLDEVLKLESSSEADLPNIIITNKIAKHLGIRVGDIVDFSTLDIEPIKAKVVGISRNYVLNFIYMTSEDFTKAFELEPVFETAFLRLNDVSDENMENALTKIIDDENVEFALSAQVVKKNINSISENMTVIIVVIQLMASILAIIVLYNLININITEREREIATLKVLGYKRSEIFAYIFSESMILTLIGSFFGIFVGIGLHKFVIAAIEVDEVTFLDQVSPMSFVEAVAFTLICCVFVNIIMQPKLNRIQPVSSLKSPE